LLAIARSLRMASAFEDGLRASQSPSGAGEVHPVLHQVTAGAFDHSGGDRPAVGQRGGVVQVAGPVGQVDGAGIGARARAPPARARAR
jgi:hypothetical protein